MKHYDTLIESILEVRASNAEILAVVNNNQPEIDAINKRIEDTFVETDRLDQQHEIEKLSMPHNHLHLKYKYGNKFGQIVQRRNRLKKHLAKLRKL